MLWVDIMTAVPFWLMDFNRDTILEAVSTSRFPVGSSAMIIFGVLSKARDIAIQIGRAHV